MSNWTRHVSSIGNMRTGDGSRGLMRFRCDLCDLAESHKSHKSQKSQKFVQFFFKFIFYFVE
jgi:hypothetical protein